VWAKYHGKHRSIAYHEEVGRVLGVSESLGLMEGAGHTAVARALAAATDAHDPANYRHSRNVAVLSVMLARAAGMSDDEICRIEIAAMLHDVGKIALPKEVTARASSSQRMRLAAREHAALGATLTTSLGLEGVSEWVRGHHERWDGQGFPDGLAAGDVPIGARIIALADAYDGMTTGAAGGSPMSKGAALQEIDLGIGTRFDPSLAELFIAIVASVDSLGWSDEWSAA
jgi:HD-GYP domain-containing protein (c-di-GMP phosphodiesterase class II)